MPTIEEARSRSDAELLRAFLLRKDEEAFERLVMRHTPMVSRVVHKFLRDREDTEDAVQVVFLILAKKARRLCLKSDLDAWLFTVARMVSLDAMRKRGNRERRLKRLTEIRCNAAESTPL